MGSNRIDGRLTSALRREEERIADERQLVRSAREELGWWLGGLAKWDSYATLTYDRRRPEVTRLQGSEDRSAYNERTCARHVKRWLGEAEKVLDRPVQAVFVVEAQKDGWPHAHGLWTAGGLQGGEFRAIGPLWFKKHGYEVLEPFETALGGLAGAYLSKYLVKADPELVLYGLEGGGLQLPLRQGDALREARGRSPGEGARRSGPLTGGSRALNSKADGSPTAGDALRSAVGTLRGALG